MSDQRQHLAHAFDIPYLVTWTDNGPSLIADIVRADKDFSNTYADQKRRLTVDRELVEALGRIDFIEQMLLSLAPVPGAPDPARLH